MAQDWGAAAPQNQKQQPNEDMQQLFMQDQLRYASLGFAPSSSQSAAAGQQPDSSAGAQANGGCVGWGGQAIPDSGGVRVPWFGRNRSKAPAHRQRASSARNDIGKDAAAAPGAQLSQSSLCSPEDGLSVEEAVLLIKRLPRADPLPERLFKALQQWDSRAVALLLKDLSKAGFDARAIEMFDRLRGLPDRHALRSLCDVFTYTAMISLCIYQLNVERAMDLLHEMRVRGVERNVHTYTALMNVCIKAGKLATALEIFQNMKNEGCTPNVVTYNTLIDVFGKLGQWDRGVNVLSLMRSEGVEPALRTYNTLIIACNMCNQPREALSVYKELLQSKFPPNSTTYNALISAYGKLGMLEQVLEVYKDMRWRGLERSVITYSSLISACEKAGHWEAALQLFDEMQRDNCTPNTVTYNSLITACGQGCQWEKAQAMFEQMQANGCTPDVVTFTALISAFERSGQWHLALRSFQQMRVQGCRPDAIVYNAIIDALWQTGVVWAQAKALEVYRVAVKSGHFSSTAGAEAGGGPRAQLNLHALTAGVAMLSMYTWLQELSQHVKENSEASLPPVLSIVTDAGGSSKEQGNFVIKEALNSMMAFWDAPFKPVQGRHFAGLLDAQGPQVAAWLRSESFPALMASLFPVLASDMQAISDDDWFNREYGAKAQCQEAFEAVLRFEASHSLALSNMPLPFLQQRTHLVSSMLEQGMQLGLKDEVVHDAVLLLDRTMSTGAQVPSELFSALGAATLHLSVSQGEPADVVPSASDVARAAGVEAGALMDMDWQVQQLLQDDTMSFSAMRCIKVFLERMGYRYLTKQGVYALAGLPIMLAVEALFDMNLLNCRPSMVAATLLYAERRQRGAVPFWPTSLAKMTGYEDLTTPELACAVRTAQKLTKKWLYAQVYKSQGANLAAATAAGGAAVCGYGREEDVPCFSSGVGTAAGYGCRAAVSEALVPASATGLQQLPAAPAQSAAAVALPAATATGLGPGFGSRWAVQLQPQVGHPYQQQQQGEGGSQQSSGGLLLLSDSALATLMGPRLIGNGLAMAPPAASSGAGIEAGRMGSGSWVQMGATSLGLPMGLGPLPTGAAPSQATQGLEGLALSLQGLGLSGNAGLVSSTNGNSLGLLLQQPFGAN